jgi:nicotinamidase-related amidase
LPFDPKRTAVVLIEYQNDFTSEGGALHGAVQNVMEITGMLENTCRLAEAARAAEATIVHAPIGYVTGYRELALHPYGILKAGIDATAFVKGEWGAEIVVSRPQANPERTLVELVRRLPLCSARGISPQPALVSKSAGSAHFTPRPGVGWSST